MHVLVTGGAGFIGSHVVSALAARGDEVTVVDCFDAYYEPALKRANAAAFAPGVRVVEADLRDRAALGAALDGVDGVIHLAARPGVRRSITEPELYVDNNVRGTQVLLDECSTAGVTNLVYASSSSVYGARLNGPFRESDPVHKPVSPYAATKLAGELLIHAACCTRELQATSLRLFTVYGPRQRPEMAIHLFARKALAGQPIVRFGDGTSTRDYTFVTDIVRGMLMSLDQPDGYRVLNLGSSSPISLNGLLEGLAGTLGVELRVEQAPDQPGDVPSTFADVTAATKALGWKPTVSLEDGLASFRNWLLTGA
ncbi:MAG: NAD-dependent epimerase/dehydratase family protein [Proteobacteria bacterium]|nr:NAD-dependent epimerase/dehydratase family protein [Pseudomonadota bacterium]MCP4916894.1 NAD-dependent epimerase/dehydratase family protein [Pseudomonadota bacterium]